jgi:hypothetical protein
MDIYKKVTRQARQFAKAYPVELSERLRWWGTLFGIDRPCLLRMIGMSPREVSEAKDRDLKDVLEDPKWELNAMSLEENLSRLLMLYGYDQHSLIDHLEQARFPPGKEKSLDLLSQRMLEGGPDTLSWTIASLVAARNGASEPEES